tara:strand:- start:320 stop:1078 length:759 start_codon:yes stop_codon:yes gene_type:complete
MAFASHYVELTGTSMSKTAIKKSKEKVCKAAESVAQVVQNTQLQVAYHFPCPIYIIERLDFLEVVKAVSDEALEIQRKEQKLDDIYPVYMTGNYYADPRLAGFSEFIGSTAWNILNEQGFAMQDKAVQFTEMWTQEHHKHSSMDAHVHGFGSQIVGFYFLETPEDCSRVVFHDPRAAKVQIDLPEQDMGRATPASKMINFQPKPGMMIFANSWLAHSFTRHASEWPIKFAHFNLTVIHQPQTYAVPPAAEIV